MHHVPPQLPRLNTYALATVLAMADVLLPLPGIAAEMAALDLEQAAGVWRAGRRHSMCVGDGEPQSACRVWGVVCGRYR